MNISNEEAWNAIYNLAIKLNLSTSGLAQKIGVSSTSFNKIYKNKNFPIRPNLIERIIKKTGIDEETFIKLSQQDKDS